MKLTQLLVIGMVLASSHQVITAMTQQPSRSLASSPSNKEAKKGTKRKFEESSQETSQPTQEMETVSTDSRMKDLEHALSQGNKELVKNLVKDGVMVDESTKQGAFKRFRTKTSTTVAAHHQSQNPLAAIPHVTSKVDAMEDDLKTAFADAQKEHAKRIQEVEPHLQDVLWVMPKTVVAIIASYQP